MQLRTQLNLVRILLVTISIVGVHSMDLNALSVRKLSLDQLTHHSGQIILCNVLKAEETFQEQEGLMLPITKLKLKVIDNILGENQTGTTVSVTMIRKAPLGAIEGKPILSGMSNIELKVGGYYLLFLTHESKIGLCTSVGLQQGCLACTPSKNGYVIKHGGHITRPGTPYTTFRNLVAQTFKQDSKPEEKE